MSQENVELVRHAMDVFNRRDLRALAEISHEDLEWTSVMAAVDTGGATYRGSQTWPSYFEAMDRIKDGQMWRMHVYLHPDEALEAMGLSE